MNLDKYNISQATHVLKCCHAMNSQQRYYYTMPCIILGRTPSRKLKAVVFGARYWKNKEHMKRIRYVPLWDVKPKEDKP